MADKNDGGDKTEKPTRKRLEDARKKGDLAKSKDFTSAIAFIAWFVLLLTATGFIGTRIVALADLSLIQASTAPFDSALSAVGWSALGVLMLASALLLIPAALGGLVAEFMQVGVVMTGEKMKPSMDKLNPFEGLKRMISLDNLVELLKTLVKAALVVAIVVAIIYGAMDEFGALIHLAAWSPAERVGPTMAGAVLSLAQSLTLQLVAWTIAVFALVAVADRVYTHYRFIKKLRMSRRDIRQEHKDSEGDPMLRAQRRQMHEEWANQNAVGAAGRANVLLVNPTHLAIALDYDPEECPVPVVAAKGEGPLAAAMRRRAEEEGVPIVRNVGLARNIWATGEVGAIIPEPLFETIAEIILWAKRARAGEVPVEREDAA
jgi:type III secretion protein U